MKKHEAGCTMNPNRVCGMCRVAGIEQQPIQELINALGDGTNLSKLRDLSENCPACILAAIRQSRVFCYDDGGLGKDNSAAFNYKAEKESLWKDINNRD